MKSLVRNRWALVPVIMLGGSVMLGVVTVSVAMRSGGESEPDYYRKRAAWEAHRAQMAQNGALAWTLTPSILPVGEVRMVPEIEVAVTDKHGVPIETAQVQVEVVPINSADARLKITLREVRPGVYGAACPMRVDGLWELRFTVTSRGRVFADVVRRVIRGVGGVGP